MLLSSPQSDVLSRRIREKINIQSPAVSIEVWLGQSVCDRIGIHHTSVGTYIRDLLRFFEEEGLSPQKPAILRLLQLPEFSADADLQEIRKELEARKAREALDDPYAQYRFHVGPFLDRARFRTVMRWFVERKPGTPRVLVVNGPGQSGKSYSSWFVSHLREAFSDFVPFAYAAEKGLAETYALDEVARDIVQRANGPLDTMPQQRAQEKRWAQELCTWILSHLNRPDRPFWLLLDGFRGAPPGTQVLIQRLAIEISQGLNQVDGRLLLFDYDPQLLMSQCPVEVEDLRSLERADITEYFQKFLRGQEASVIERAVTKVFELVTLQPTDPGWQHQIARAVREVTDAIA